MKWTLVVVALAVVAIGPACSGPLAAAQESQTSSTPGGSSSSPNFVPTEKVPAGSAVSFPVDI